MKNEQKPITFWDCPIEELNRAELDDEIRMQKYLRALLKREFNVLKKRDLYSKSTNIRNNKMDFLDAYVKVLDGFIADLESRAKTKSDGTNQKQATKANKVLQRQKTYVEQRADYDGTELSWDKEKFMLVARDRGYLTEQSIIYAVEKELAITRSLSKVLLEKGKFTWGQVMCIGAMLRMTPKEFCDIFLSGYFVEYYGQFEASYQNIDKTVLLKRATVMNSKELAKIDTVAAEMEAKAD